MAGDERDDPQREETGLSVLDEEAEQQIRRVWHDGRWFFSVTDVIGMLTGLPKPRQYWFDMKRNLHDEGFLQLSEKIRQLKMNASDGKQRLTAAADAQTLLLIVQSVPSPKAEPLKQWLRLPQVRAGHVLQDRPLARVGDGIDADVEWAAA